MKTFSSFSFKWILLSQNFNLIVNFKDIQYRELVMENDISIEERSILNLSEILLIIS